MKRFLAIALAALTVLAPAHAVRAASVKVPLASYPGQPNQPVKAGDTVGTPAPTTTNASLNLPQGTAPSSPNNGDVWTTSAGLYVRINGATIGPLSAGGSPGGSSGQVQYNNSGSFGGFTVAGDGTLNTSTGALTVTKTSGVAFGYFATGTDAANLTGTVGVNRFNSGTGASSSTFLRGDGTWATPSSSLPSIAAGHIIGNGTGSTATAADSTLTSILDQAFGSSQGAMLYRGASTWTLLSPGSSGQVLQTNGAGANPSWVTPTGGSVGSGAMTLITEQVTSGSQTSVTFSSISSSYRDLFIRVRGRGTASAVNVTILLQFNGDTASNYEYQYNYGNGTTGGTAVQSLTQSAIAVGALAGATATANFAGQSEALIANYIGTTFYKSLFATSAYDWGGSSAMVALSAAGFWKSTSAISSVKVFLSSGAFVDGSVVSLYGSL